MRKIKRRTIRLDMDLVAITINDLSGALKQIGYPHIMPASLCQNNPHLLDYFKLILKLSLYFGQKNKIKKNQWFFINEKKLKRDLSHIKSLSGNSHKKRTQFDKELETLEYIKTKFEGYPRRKKYKVNWQLIIEMYYTVVNIVSALPSVDTVKNKKTWEHLLIYIYINIYNINVKIGGFGKPPKVLANAKTESISSRKIKRRGTSPVDKVISHWSSLGHPIAKVYKRPSISPIISKLLKSNNFDHREIIRVIDIAFEYFKSPYFKYQTGRNIPIKSFFVVNNYQDNLIGNFLISNKVKSWFKLFQTKSPVWLNENLLKYPKIKDDEVFQYIYEYFKIDKLNAIQASNKMAVWMQANNYPLRTMATDFDNFMRDKYPDARKFKVFWLKGSKFWNDQFAKYLVKFGRYNNINEVKKI